MEDIEAFQMQNTKNLFNTCMRMKKMYQNTKLRKSEFQEGFLNFIAIMFITVLLQFQYHVYSMVNTGRLNRQLVGYQLQCV